MDLQEKLYVKTFDGNKKTSLGFSYRNSYLWWSDQSLCIQSKPNSWEILIKQLSWWLARFFVELLFGLNPAKPIQESKRELKNINHYNILKYPNILLLCKCFVNTITNRWSISYWTSQKQWNKFVITTNNELLQSDGKTRKMLLQNVSYHLRKGKCSCKSHKGLWMAASLYMIVYMMSR